MGSLAVLEDAEGSIAMGLAAYGVAYLCFVGRISENLGSWCARRLNRLLDRGCHTVFLDAHAVEGGATSACSATLAARCFHSRSIARVVGLVPASVAPLTARVAGAGAGFEPIVTASATEFDALLAEAAPRAHDAIGVANCRRVQPSTMPPLRIVRSA